MLNLLLQERNYRFQVVWHLLCERSGRALARWEMWVTQYGNWYELIDVYLFVCLFCSSFSSISRMFHSYGDVIITGEGPRSREDSLTFHAKWERDLGFNGLIQR